MPNSGPEQAQVAAPSNLALRVGSALVLAPAAIAASFVGGWVFLAFWAFAAAAIWWEWLGLVSDGEHRSELVTGAGALIAAALLAGIDHFEMSFFLIALGALAMAVMTPRSRVWVVGGLIYAGALLLSAIAIRFGMQSGHLVIFFLFAVVWTTDVVAYFVGRALGGPKLAPAISPKKTWSGAIGGSAAAVGVAVAFVAWAGSPGSFWRIGGLALLLSALSQAGDLFESFVKRRFAAKDASGLIPGHGGVMDRLDGFVAAALGLALLDAAWPGAGAPIQDLFGW